MATGKTISKTFVWIIIGLAMLGLGGFGASNMSGTIRTIGTVGDKHIDVGEYARQLGQEIRAVEAQSGESLPFARVQEIGLDQAVLARIVSARALDHEATQLGLSIGDAALRDQIVDIPAFQGVDGSFDREGYTFALERSGTSEADFETRLREETARTLLQGAMVGGVVMPDTYVSTLLNYIGETRNFTWARLASADLDTPLPTASDEVLLGYFNENIDQFMLSETKRITYAHLSPDALIQSIEVPEEDLRAEFEARANEYNRPERRLVERLVYLDEESANQAAAALEVSGTTFEALVEERGLALADVDLGDMDRLSLDGAGEAVFAANVGDVVGPLASDLGPALFRINGVLPAQITTFEDAKPQLQEILAADRARRLVSIQAQDYDDLLAGGATLEELADETDLVLGTIDWSDGNGEGLGAYVGFAEAARALTAEDFPKIENLEDGGVFAIRLEEELPVRPSEFADSREQVVASWENNQLETRLNAQAATLVPQLQSGTDFAGLGLAPTEEINETRTGFVTGTPPSFMQGVFKMAVGDVIVVDSFGTVLLVRLDAINSADTNENVEALRDQLQTQVSQALARDIYNIYSRDAVMRAGQKIDPRSLAAVHVNFP
ncbi:MAG: peptidyl-prolyl cis-trans isomerase D [Ascidiaceihabitans sp.]|jgi:peptidyl-prolyl cis-trans isomerase D|tara:strand:- start:553 stop:2394 length:1842 start_codon:yes stop_codon:yes gene_type:complete